MAISKGAPDRKAVNPIQLPTSRGVISKGDRANLLRRSAGVMASAKDFKPGSVAASGAAASGTA